MNTIVLLVQLPGNGEQREMVAESRAKEFAEPAYAV
jgi:hypothetical protein